MSAREELLEMVQLVLQRLPEDATVHNLIEELLGMESVEQALREVQAGRFLTLEEFARRTQPCLTK